MKVIFNPIYSTYLRFLDNFALAKIWNVKMVKYENINYLNFGDSDRQIWKYLLCNNLQLKEEKVSDISSYPDYIWWLEPGKLAGMPRPHLKDLPAIYQAGIRGIVSVMDEPSNIQEYQDYDFEALWLPITGGKSPTVKQVLEFVQFADSLLKKNQVVAVHCTSGNRRTGTLLAAYLIVSGKSPDQALIKVQQARPSAQLRDAQKEFLYALPNLLTWNFYIYGFSYFWIGEKAEI